MFSCNYKNISVFSRLKDLVAFSPGRSYLLKHYHSRTRRTVKCYFRNGKSNVKNNFKAVSLTAVAGVGAYACSFISKKSDPLFEDETEDEFDELFYQESVKEDIQLLIEYGKIPYLLIGSGPAAMSAYRAIRIQDPTAKVVMICEERFNPYHYPSLSSELWYFKNNDPTAWRERLFYDEDYLSVQQMLENKNGGLSLLRGKKVVKIDPVSQSIVLDAGEEIAYEKCLLTTGTKPKKFNIFEEAENNIQDCFTVFHSLQDFIKLEKSSKHMKSIAVIGCGFLASELASGLSEFNKSRDVSVVQICPEERILSNILPEYLSQYVERKFQSRNIHVVPNVTVKAVNKVGNKVELHLSNEEIFSVDHIVVAAGLGPNTDTASSSGLETDSKHGGFMVNAEMRARKNLWIAGEASSFYDSKCGRRRVEHYTDAAESGRVAGENMTGGAKPLSYHSRWWSLLGPHTFCEGFGKVDSKLETIGVFKAPSSDNTVGEGLRKSSTENQGLNSSSVVTQQATLPNSDQYRKGVVFYLSNDIVVGILLWNAVIDDPRIAKKVLEQAKSKEDVLEIAKLFQNNIKWEQ